MCKCTTLALNKMRCDGKGKFYRQEGWEETEGSDGLKLSDGSDGLDKSDGSDCSKSVEAE